MNNIDNKIINNNTLPPLKDNLHFVKYNLLMQFILAQPEKESIFKEQIDILLDKFETKQGFTPIQQQKIEIIEKLAKKVLFSFDQAPIGQLPSQIIENNKTKLAPYVKLFGPTTLAFKFGRHPSHSLVIYKSPLDQGTFNQVFKAYSLSKGRLVVLRSLKQNQLAFPHKVKSWEKEKDLHLYIQNFTIQGLAKIHTVIDYYNKNPCSWTKGFVMPLYEGDLESLIKDHPSLVANQLHSIALQLAYTLSYLHHIPHHEQASIGYIHGDLKLNNILFDIHNGNITTKITDLGGMLAIGKQQQIKSVRVFLPPEIFLNGAREDSKIDSWALGLVLFKLKYGQSKEYKLLLSSTKKALIEIEYLKMQVALYFDPDLLAEMQSKKRDENENLIFPEWLVNSLTELYKNDLSKAKKQLRKWDKLKLLEEDHPFNNTATHLSIRKEIFMKNNPENKLNSDGKNKQLDHIIRITISNHFLKNYIAKEYKKNLTSVYKRLDELTDDPLRVVIRALLEFNSTKRWTCGEVYAYLEENADQKSALPG